MKKLFAWMTAAALLPPPLLAQNDPLVDMLNNRNYDREAILQQYKNLNITVSPPPSTQEEETPAEPAAAPAAAGETAPVFRPLTPQLPPAVAGQKPLDAVALILPLNGIGKTATAAEVFNRGCVDALKAANALIQVDTYAHDGSSGQAITAYQNAVDNGALFVIGPMQKNNVRALLQAYPQAPVNTLLLQPAATDAAQSLYYVLTLDIGEEAAELARLISEQFQRVLIVADNSPLSRRQKAAFARAWAEANNTPPEYFYIYDANRDWQKLFDRLKHHSESSTETPSKDAEPPLVLFAAGDGKFIRRARNFVPQGYALYASSIFFSDTDDARFLDNLHSMEMPWFVAAENKDIRSFAEPQMRTRPPLQQRFYALGADACRAAQQSLLWFDGWRMEGASGTLQLTAGTFRRRGILSQYQSGYLKPLPR